LVALEARIRVTGAKGERTIAMEDFHRLPGDTPEKETELQPGELITAVELPPSPYAGHSHYIKVRDRASYEFALVSAAAALDLQGGQIRSARIAMGGVAHKPWRAKAAEQALVGKPATKENFQAAAAVALEGAKPQTHNGFKVELAKRAIVRALEVAGGVA
jgi:xanthine dehydrogenase YagS FAD-binding subunit